MIDFKPYLLKKKLKYINEYKEKDEKEREEIQHVKFYLTECELANFIERLNDNYKDDIQQQNAIRAIIQYQNAEKTQDYFKL